MMMITEHFLKMMMINIQCEYDTNVIICVLHQVSYCYCKPPYPATRLPLNEKASVVISTAHQLDCFSIRLLII